MKELTNEHKKNLERLLMESEYIFSNQNKGMFSRKIYKIKSGLMLNNLKDEGYNINNYVIKLANIYITDKYSKNSKQY